jgi:hypothetical protein
MGTEITVALITILGNIIVALISKSAEANSQSEQTGRRDSPHSSDASQTYSGNASSKSTVEQGAGTFFLIAWVCACTAGWTMGWLMGALLGGASPITLNVISGLIIGVAQWYVLQNKLRESGWWVLATASSGIGAGFAFSILGSTGFTIVGIIFANIIGGLFAGIAQWLILQRQVHGSGHWVVITTVAWVMGGTVGNIFTLSSGNFAIGGLVCGVIIGLITGSQLALLLNRPH